MPRQYVSSMETFSFPLATTTGGEFPTGAQQPASARQVLDLSPDVRQVTFEATLFSPDGSYTRVIPNAAIPPNVAWAVFLPYIIIGFKQGPVGGYQKQGPVSGVGQGVAYAHVITPDVPVVVSIPPGYKVWANSRGAAIPTPPAAPIVSTIRLSVTSTTIVEPEYDGPQGQAEHIVKGIRSAFVETIPQAIADALARIFKK